MKNLIVIFISGLILSVAHAKTSNLNRCFNPSQPRQTLYQLTIETSDVQLMKSIQRQILIDKVIKVSDKIGSIQKDHYTTMLISLTPQLIRLVTQNDQLAKVDAGVFEYVRRLMVANNVSTYTFNCTQSLNPQPRAGGTN